MRPDPSFVASYRTGHWIPGGLSLLARPVGCSPVPKAGCHAVGSGIAALSWSCVCIFLGLGWLLAGDQQVAGGGSRYIKCQPAHHAWVTNLWRLPAWGGDVVQQQSGKPIPEWALYFVSRPPAVASEQCTDAPFSATRCVGACGLVVACCALVGAAGACCVLWLLLLLLFGWCVVVVATVAPCPLTCPPKA